jgi:hypothetical protein
MNSVEAPSHRNSAVRPLVRLNSGGASFPRAAARKPEKQGVSGAASSPLHFSAGGEDPCHLQKEKTHKQQRVLIVSFF